ncbi:DUF4132 domain-containing protein [Micromonospora sp. LOL_023]|uniref:DUF4132 domain-containing protein n=1 Tax=Micromonospora sp. LOL_023 TaxID=3345418 RepID=UPI003A877C40
MGRTRSSGSVSGAGTNSLTSASAGRDQVVDEDTFVVPATWLRSMLARRGLAGEVQKPDLAARDGVAKLVDKLSGPVEQILRHGDTDPAVAAAGLAQLAGSPSPLGAAAVAAAAIEEATDHESDLMPDFAELWLGDRGLPFAAAATAELMSLEVKVSLQRGHLSTLRHFIRYLPADSSFGNYRWTVATRVRAALAAAPDDQYAAGVAALTPFLKGTLHQRAAAVFLAPTETGWHDETVAAVATTGNRTLASLLLSAVVSAEHVRRLEAMPYDATTLYSLVAGVGPAVAPMLAGWLDGGYWPTAERRRWLSVLAVLPTDEAFQLLLDRVDQKLVLPVVMDAARRYPGRALRLLAGSRRPELDDLLWAHVTADPGAAERMLPTLPGDAAGRVRDILAASAAVREAPEPALPTLLVRPPWSGKRKARTPAVVDNLVCRDEPSVVWLVGERDRWRDGGEDRCDDTHDWAEVAASVRRGDEDVDTLEDFYVGAPEELARPLVVNWRPGPWLTDEDLMRIVVARFELDALPAALAIARQEPAAMAGVLLPYAAPEIAVLMADWLHRLKSVRVPAMAWLTRHAAAAARALIPAAFGGPGRARRQAVHALDSLVRSGHAEEIRAAAKEYGPPAVAALDDLLAGDPLDALPPKIPELPPWLGLGLLPRIRLRDETHVLPMSAVEHVVTMVAMSPPGHPYAGVAVVKDLCEPRDLAGFAWALFERWQAAGSPAAQGWALTTLGLFGDDETVRRLAPLIRVWPGESRHPWAVAGLDVLASIGTEVALMHLHLIAQKVKFQALRQRANLKLREVAERLGIRPEQLADRLVPDLGLDATGSLTLDYGPRQFVVGFDEQLRPFVRDADGKQRRDLPRPGVKDDQTLAPAARRRFLDLKKDVRAIAAAEIHRLEQAMVTRRRWTGAEFRQFVVAHPLLWHLARRLVWGHYDERGNLVGAVRLAEDRTFADLDDDQVSLPDDAVVGVAHPVHLAGTVAAWAEVFADYEILQPFPQLGREAPALTEAELTAHRLTRFEGITVATSGLLGLERRGWYRSHPLTAGFQREFIRDLPGGGAVVIDLDPGIAIGYRDEYPKQRLATVAVQNVRLGEIEPVSVWELARDLAAVTA